MPSDAVRPKRKLLRILLLCMGGLLLLVALLVGAVMVLLSHIDTPALKQRIVGAAAAQGIALDYDEAAVSLGQLHLTKLRIAQPPPDEAAEPLLAIERIDVSFNPWGAVFGGRFRVEGGLVQGVRAVLFSDEDGQSSITRLLARMPPSAPKKKKEPEPLSKTLADLSKLPLVIHGFQLEQVSARMVERTAHQEIKRTDFTGLLLSVSDLKGALDVLLATPESGAQLDLTEGGKTKELLADVRAQFVWSARGKAPHGDLDVELKLRHQDLLALPPQAPHVANLLSFQAGVTPTPAQQKSAVQLTGLKLLDGAGSGHLDVELVDDGKGGVKPSIHEAVFDLLLERLRPFVPESAGVLSALSGSMNVRAFGINLSHGLRVSPEGGAEVRAEIPQLKWRAGKQSAELTNAKLELHAKPAGDGAALELKMPIELVRATANGQSISLTHANVKSQAHATLAYRVTGQLTATLAALHVLGPQTLDATDAELRLSLKDADLAATGPLHVAGGVAAELEFGKLGAKAGGMTIDAADLKLRAPLHLSANAASGSVAIHLESAQLGVKRAGAVLLSPTEVTAELNLARFGYLPKHPLFSTAEGFFDLDLGDAKLHLLVDKHERDLTYELQLKSPSLALARPFVSAEQRAQVPWAQVGISVSSKGSVSHLGTRTPSLEQETRLIVDQGAFHDETFELGAEQLQAHLTSQGTAQHHEADLSMGMRGLTIQGQKSRSEELLKTHLLFDRAQPKVELQFEAHGEACPEGKLGLSIGFEREPARVSYAVDGELHHLELIPKLLPPALLAHTDLEWKTLTVALQGKGDLTGVVTSMKDLKPILAPNPLKTMRGAQSFELALGGLDYSNDNDQAVVLSSAKLHLDATEQDSGKHLTFTASSPSGELDASGVQAKFEALTSALELDLGAASLRAKLHLGFGALKQDAQPSYPVGDATFDAQLSAGSDGTLHIDSAKLDNVAGGTTISASGVLEAMLAFTDGAPRLRPVPTGAAAEQRDLKLQGDLVQRLAALPEGLGFTGRGTLRVPFSAESSDFHYFRVVTGLEFQDAYFDFTGRKLALSKLNAKVPIRLKFRLDESGTMPLGGARPGVYSRERFVDYQPYLGSEDFITCESIRIGESTVGPLAANLRIDRNVIALDQLEMSAFGGKITGQFVMDLDMAKRELTDVQFRGNVTGLAPGHGEERSSEVVDANAALRLNPRRMELEGRVDIVRIGRDDLRAMLDTWDPYHSDESANRTRKALLAGYPKDVRLGFHQGFTQITMEMGGLAGLSALDPIQVSTGPILQKYVAPYLKLMAPKKPKVNP